MDREVELVGALQIEHLVDDADVRPGELLAGDGLLHDRAGNVDRDGEADAVGVRGNGGVDADDVAAESSSGPPLLPGLIAVSVWSRLLIRPLLSTSMLRPVADRMPLVTVLVYVPSGLPIAIVDLAHLEGRGIADGRGRQIGRIDLDDGQVGERVDPVDGAIELAPVLELDGQLAAARHDVAVGEDPAVLVVEDPGADALGGRGVDVVRIGRADDPDDGRTGLRGHVDDGRRLVDLDRLCGARVLAARDGGGAATGSRAPLARSVR